MNKIEEKINQGLCFNGIWTHITLYRNLDMRNDCLLNGADWCIDDKYDTFIGKNKKKEKSVIVG